MTPIDYIRIDAEILELPIHDKAKFLMGLVKRFNCKGLMMSNPELAKVLGCSEDHVCRLLKEVGEYIRIENPQSRYRKIFYSGVQAGVKIDLLRRTGRSKNVSTPTSAQSTPTSAQSTPTSAQSTPTCMPDIIKRTKRTKRTISKSSELPKTGSQKKPEAVQQVFDYWNRYAGRSVEKPSGQGGLKSIRWKSHRTLGKDKRLAIEQALKDYPAEEVCGAIENFALVLLGYEYFWSYPWSLHEFLTRGEEKHKAAARKWWAWLPDNFDPERYRRQGADDEVHVKDFTPEEDREYYEKHPNPPMTAEQVNHERAKIGWPEISEAELAELPHTEEGLILVTAEVREKWSAEYLERKKVKAS